MTTDRDGVAESGKALPIGTKCVYLSHLTGRAVKVRIEDGTEEVVHPSIFAQLR